MDYKKQNFRKIANIITLSRFLLVLPLIISLNYRVLSIAWLVIVIGILTDIFDGYFAKLSGGGSKWGAKMDPLADKIIIMVPLLWLNQHSIIPFWAVWLILSRELLITIVRSTSNSGTPASKAGKFKTVLQFSTILCLLWPYSWTILNYNLINFIGVKIFWLSVIVTLISGFSYIKYQVKTDPKKNQVLENLTTDNH